MSELKFIVLPYCEQRGKLMQLAMRRSATAANAIRLAEAISARHVGVVAFAVKVDNETGDLIEPHELARFGTVPDMDIT